MNAIRLTWDEIEQAAIVGIRRQTTAIAGGLENQHGYTPDPATEWGTHVVAAITEMATAKYLKRFWSGSRVGTFKGDDVDGGIQVRYSRRTAGCLLVRPGDADGAVMVLVIIGPPGEFLFPGWMRAGDAKRPEWKYDDNGRPPCYLVPQSALCPMEALCTSIH